MKEEEEEEEEDEENIDPDIIPDSPDKTPRSSLTAGRRLEFTPTVKKDDGSGMRPFRMRKNDDFDFRTKYKQAILQEASDNAQEENLRRQKYDEVMGAKVFRGYKPGDFRFGSGGRKEEEIGQ